MNGGTSVIEPRTEALSLDEIASRIERAEREVIALCAGPNRPGGRRWRMTVPVDPTDSDIVLMDALLAARKLIARHPNHGEIGSAFCALCNPEPEQSSAPEEGK